MEQSRYRDKAYLVTYELTTDMFEEFGIKIDDILPVRSEFMLFTDSGAKILKKINYGLEELEFINSAIEHIGRNGYEFVIRFLKARDGNFYIKRDDGIYVVLNIVEGREIDFGNTSDISSVSRALCRLHKSTQGMETVLKKRDYLYRWVPVFEKRSQELLKFKEIADLHEIKTGFDRLYLNYVDKYYEESLKSIELLKSSSYEKLCDIINLNGNICHHNLAFYNIIINEDGNVYFSDFDSCIQDLRIHDIGNLIIKSVRNSGWGIEKAENILISYSSEDELLKGEVEALYGFLVFPQDFYDVSRSYYMKTKKWEEDDFLARLQVKAGYYADRKVFLDNFRGIAEKWGA